MNEHLQFVAWHLASEKLAPLCREFGISRKTGHKIVKRYRDHGLEALTDRSRRPYRQANQLPFQVEILIVEIKKINPTGARPKSVNTCHAATILRDVGS